MKEILDLHRGPTNKESADEVGNVFVDDHEWLWFGNGKLQTSIPKIKNWQTFILNSRNVQMNIKISCYNFSFI